tara:strand:- start:192 stop:404 length:213 start_codon:yes stop_codon:yes gene_type:complete
MGVMIVSVVIVAVLTLIGTVIWWAMMNAWESKDRAARGRHVTDRDPPTGGPQPRSRDQRDDGDGPVVVKL